MAQESAGGQSGFARPTSSSRRAGGTNRKRDVKADAKMLARQGSASTARRSAKSASSAARKKAAAAAALKNRTRKSKGQKEALWELYKAMKGETPTRDHIARLSEELNLKEN